MALNVALVSPTQQVWSGEASFVSARTTEGETTVDGAFHIDRGYPNFAERLVALGAKVSRD